MTFKRPQTIERLDRHFIVKATINSTTALQMAIQAWNDPALMRGEIQGYVDIINTASIKLKDLCQYQNYRAHRDYNDQEIKDKKIVELKECNT